MGKNKTKKKNQSRDTSNNVVPHTPTLHQPKALSQAFAKLTARPTTLVEVSLTPQTPDRVPEPLISSGDTLVRMLELLDERNFVISSTWEGEKYALKSRPKYIEPDFWGLIPRLWWPRRVYRWTLELFKAFGRTCRGPARRDSAMTLLLAGLFICGSYVALELLLNILRMASAQDTTVDAKCSIVYVTVPGPIITVSLIEPSPANPAAGSTRLSSPRSLLSSSNPNTLPTLPSDPLPRQSRTTMTSLTSGSQSITLTRVTSTTTGGLSSRPTGNAPTSAPTVMPSILSTFTGTLSSGQTITMTRTSKTIIHTTPSITSSSLSSSGSTSSSVPTPSSLTESTTPVSPSSSMFSWPSTRPASSPRTSTTPSRNSPSSLTSFSTSMPPVIASSLSGSRLTSSSSPSSSFLSRLSLAVSTSVTTGFSSSFVTPSAPTFSSSNWNTFSSFVSPSSDTGFMTIQTSTLTGGSTRTSTSLSVSSSVGSSSILASVTSVAADRGLTTRVIAYGDTKISFVFPTPDITTTVSYWTGQYPTVTGPLPSDLETISPTTRSTTLTPISTLPSLEFFSSGTQYFKSVVTTMYNEKGLARRNVGRETAAETGVTRIIQDETRIRAEMSVVQEPGPAWCGESGNFTLNFDDTTVGSSGDQVLTVKGLRNPYHHLFYANGYTDVPDKWEPYPAISQPNIAMFLPLSGRLLPNQPFAGTLLPGELGAGPRASVSAYWFNAYSGYFGCALNGITPCLLRISGYRYDGVLKEEVLVAEQNTTIAACWGYIGCRLTQIKFNDEFRGLSGIQFNAYTAGLGIPQVHMLDDLQLEWYNNSCSAGILRIGNM